MSINRYRGKHLRDRKRGRKLTGRCSECGRRCEDGDVCGKCAPPEIEHEVADELPEPDAKTIQMHSKLDHDEKKELARMALFRLMFLPMGDDDADPFDEEIERRLVWWCASKLTDAAEGVAIAEEVWADAQDAYETNPDGLARRVRRTDWLIDAYDDPMFRAMSTMI